MWSEQMKAAIGRGLIIAIPAGILTTLTTWSQTDEGKTVIIAGVTSLLTTFLARSGLEGLYDTNRANTGDVHASDVSATPAV